jgi:hypothetical protein
LNSNYKSEVEAEVGDSFVNISEKIGQRFDENLLVLKACVIRNNFFPQKEIHIPREGNVLDSTGAKEN